MNDSAIFSLFLSWQTALLCLGIYLLTYVIRTVMEAIAKSRGLDTQLRGSIVWNELVLPIGPIFNGALIAFFAKKFPWPEVVASSLSARMMYGAVAGVACGWFYARFRALVMPVVTGGGAPSPITVIAPVVPVTTGGALPAPAVVQPEPPQAEEPPVP